MFGCIVPHTRQSCYTNDTVSFFEWEIVSYGVNNPSRYNGALIGAVCLIHRGSYNSAYHVLLNLLNELGKRDKMLGLPSILSLFRNEFNKLNNTRVRMIYSVYHIT